MQCHALFIHVPRSRTFKVLQSDVTTLTKKMNRTRYVGPNGATNENRFAKCNQNCDVTKENRTSQNNPILLQQLLNNGISLHITRKKLLHFWAPSPVFLY